VFTTSCYTILKVLHEIVNNVKAERSRVKKRPRGAFTSPTHEGHYLLCPHCCVNAGKWHLHALLRRFGFSLAHPFPSREAVEIKATGAADFKPSVGLQATAVHLNGGRLNF